MVKAIMHGCGGRMGTMISERAKDYADFEIVAGVDCKASGTFSYPVYKTLYDVKESADVIIDCSQASAVSTLIEFAKEKRMPVIICTTGLSDEQNEKINELSKETAVLRSGNMSLGINTIIKVLNNISPLLFDAGFDIEIIEKHHGKKLDAPSGTALMLADAASENLAEKPEYVYGRNERREERPKNEIGISAVRGGTIVGEHEVIFAGSDEIIEIKHTALSRAVFANGAINAAMFLVGKEAGLYTMADVVG